MNERLARVAAQEEPLAKTSDEKLLETVQPVEEHKEKQSSSESEGDISLDCDGDSIDPHDELPVIPEEANEDDSWNQVSRNAAAQNASIISFTPRQRHY